MTLRRYAPVAALAAVVALALSAGSADARTIRVHWTDSQPWGGGHVVYRTSKIWVHGGRFSVTVSVTNRSKYAIRFFPSTSYDPVYRRPPGFGVAWRPKLLRGTIEGRALRSVAAGTFSPSLPTTLGIGKTWSGTFGGYSQALRSHRAWWVTFGLISPWVHHHVPSRYEGPHGSYWVSARTFST